MQLFGQMGYPFLNGNQVILIIAAIWSLAWKGFALWKAARAERKYWFIAMLLTNTLGILEIIFIVFFQKKSKPKK